MNTSTFNVLLKSFQQAKELSRGLQSLSPVTSLMCQNTTQRTPHSLNHVPCHHLHTVHEKLVPTQSVMLQQVRHKRKLFPDPFEQDPEYYILPDEKTHLDLSHVPVLGNKGPELARNIQEAAKGDNLGRLFAIVHIGGEQRKITTEDLVMVHGFFPPQIGDKIRLEKVMLVGGKDFTLFGRPLLDRNLVRVEATVIEKSLSHVKVNFVKMKRFRRLKLHQNPVSVMVINSIEVDASALTQS